MRIYQKRLKTVTTSTIRIYRRNLLNLTIRMSLKLESRFATACIQFYAANLIYNQSYALFVENSNQNGRPLHFWFYNENDIILRLKHT